MVSVNRNYERSLLSVSPSTRDRRQGVLNAAVVLVMYGDYQHPQSADVYRLIKAIQQQLSVSWGADYLCFRRCGKGNDEEARMGR